MHIAAEDVEKCFINKIYEQDFKHSILRKNLGLSLQTNPLVNFIDGDEIM